MKKVNEYPGPYHWYLSKFFNHKHAYAARLARTFLKRTWKACDIGCGDGRMEELLADSVKQLDGYDNQERPLQFARLLCTKKNVTFTRNTGSIPAQDKTYDAVLCFDVIEHIAPNQLRGFIDEMKRVLKDGGTLILTTPNKRELRGRIFGHNVDPKHYKEYDIPELEDLLRKNGLTVKYTTGIYVTPPLPHAEHFASVYPFFWIFQFLVWLGTVFPSLAETTFLVAKK